MAKVYLSPSSQVSNPYAWGSTNEAAQCRRIADAAAAALTRSGLSVKNNQTASMEGRVAESNAWGADLHVCIHTNAFNGRVTGTRVFSWNDAGRGRAAAQAVFDELAPLTPGTSDSLSTNQTWYELRRTAAPCVYVEAEFHDNAEATRWIIEHTQQIGEAVARGICRYFGVALRAHAGAGGRDAPPRAGRGLRRARKRRADACALARRGLRGLHHRII